MVTYGILLILEKVLSTCSSPKIKSETTVFYRGISTGKHPFMDIRYNPCCVWHSIPRIQSLLWNTPKIGYVNVWNDLEQEILVPRLTGIPSISEL
jgi:hypothetical protein